MNDRIMWTATAALVLCLAKVVKLLFQIVVQAVITLIKFISSIEIAIAREDDTKEHKDDKSKQAKD